MIDDWQRQAAIDLCSVVPSKESLLRLISWLDLTGWDAEPASLPRQMLARAVAAAGFALLKTMEHENIRRTTRAAVCFALAPSGENSERLFEAATDSYPFGPGEGCYALAETGYPDCEPGSGCRSGAGCLWIPELGETCGMDVIAGALLPWLLGKVDPLL